MHHKFDVKSLPDWSQSSSAPHWLVFAKIGELVGGICSDQEGVLQNTSEFRLNIMYDDGDDVLEMSDSYRTPLLCPVDILKSPGVTQWSILIDEKSDEKIDQAMRGRNDKNQDVIMVTKEGLGNVYEKPKMLFAERVRSTQEEVRDLIWAWLTDTHEDEET
ncbi:hypothetical protein ACEPAG_3419 [Sanghuangporus baumii]